MSTILRVLARAGLIALIFTCIAASSRQTLAQDATPIAAEPTETVITTPSSEPTVPEPASTDVPSPTAQPTTHSEAAAGEPCTPNEQGTHNRIVTIYYGTVYSPSIGQNVSPAIALVHDVNQQVADLIYGHSDASAIDYFLQYHIDDVDSIAWVTQDKTIIDAKASLMAQQEFINGDLVWQPEVNRGDYYDFLTEGPRFDGDCTTHQFYVTIKLRELNASIGSPSPTAIPPSPTVTTTPSSTPVDDDPCTVDRTISRTVEFYFGHAYVLDPVTDEVTEDLGFSSEATSFFTVALANAVVASIQAQELTVPELIAALSTWTNTDAAIEWVLDPSPESFDARSNLLANYVDASGGLPLVATGEAPDFLTVNSNFGSVTSVEDDEGAGCEDGVITVTTHYNATFIAQSLDAVFHLTATPTQAVPTATSSPGDPFATAAPVEPTAAFIPTLSASSDIAQLPSTGSGRAATSDAATLFALGALVAIAAIVAAMVRRNRQLPPD